MDCFTAGVKTPHLLALSAPPFEAQGELKPCPPEVALVRRCALAGGAGAVQEQFAFAGVAREGGGAFEIGLGFGKAAELEEKIGADAWEEMVGLERGIRRKRLDEFETCCRTESHADGNGTIEFNHWRGRPFAQLLIERSDSSPVGSLCIEGARMAGSDGGLERVRTGGGH